MTTPARQRNAADVRDHVPVHVVWEITLACDLKCKHCGSRAGARRERELTTAECLEVVDALARLGSREVTLIGGEAYLRSDWVAIVRAIRERGMRCTMQTGGRNLTPARLCAGIEAGLQGLGVSVDGLAPLHDRMRGVAGSFEKALGAVRLARSHGLAVGVNTQIGAETMADLPGVFDAICEAGATHWQVQLTVAMGNAVDNDDVLLQPYQVAELMPLLARLHRLGLERGVLLIPGNNIGYFGPFEGQLRGAGNDVVHWTGCAAGKNVLGIEADGTVKGCPSLRTNGYAGGNVRDASVEDIWASAPEIHFGRLRDGSEMWGFCRSCYYADVCRGGCTWTADSLFGRPGNNPYCHHRVIELARQGLRERVVKTQEAPDAPFAIGRFSLITESTAHADTAAQVETKTHAHEAELMPARRLVRRRGSPVEHESAEPLVLCRGCDRHVFATTVSCPHCGVDVAREGERFEEALRRERALVDQLLKAVQHAQTSAAYLRSL